MNHPLRERLYRTPAVVLQCRDLGEADRIFVIFTPSQGKFSVIAKGARRSKSRLGPFLDVCAEVELNLTRGRDLDVVTGVVAINQHPSLRTNIDAFGHAAHFTELVRDLTEDRQEHPRLYELLASSLALLDADVEPWHVSRHFELGLLVELGYRPELIRCVACGSDLNAEPNVFSSVMGGMLCAACAISDRSGLHISVNAQKYLRTLARSGLSTAITLRLTERERLEISQVMLTYLRYVGERDFTSLQVLGTMLGGQRS